MLPAFQTGRTIRKHPVGCFLIVRPGRIELPTEPWQGPVIPLNQGRGIVFILFY